MSIPPTAEDAREEFTHAYRFGIDTARRGSKQPPTLPVSSEDPEPLQRYRELWNHAAHLGYRWDKNIGYAHVTDRQRQKDDEAAFIARHYGTAPPD